MVVDFNIAERQPHVLSAQPRNQTEEPSLSKPTIRTGLASEICVYYYVAKNIGSYKLTLPLRKQCESDIQSCDVK